ncbi:MAG: formylglycine-generating enzyme family protein [Burkholderiaceae bacterium]|nr:formylglycine-generating enzyme family protein [Burkholderiaceae bacterium]
MGRYAWYEDNSGDKTHPVEEEKAPNPWGLYDMYGNVGEWVQDRYGDYSSASVTDPRGPFFGSRRVVRGGSWFFSAKYSRAAIRYNSSPDLRGGYLGFRLARDAD